MNSFFPQDTKKPEKAAGNYMKLQDDVNRIRIVTDAIVGWVYWVPGENGNNKPVRVKECPDEVPAEAVEDKYGNFIKNFYAFGVYNYQENKVQILEITQSSIQEAIFDYNVDEDWGSPKAYDLKITRKNEGGKVKYTVNAVGKDELPMKVANAVAEKPMNLEALFDNADPFVEVVDIASINV